MNADEPPPGTSSQRALWARAREHLSRLIHATLQASNRLRLPGPSVLPVAGAVVGLYSGLAAGIFANLIGLVTGLTFGAAELAHTLRRSQLVTLWEAFTSARWHPEYAIIGAPLALGGLLLARVIEPGGPRDEVKRRLRLLALLTLGALSLYYPLVALAALNSVFGHSHSLADAIPHLPWWLMLLAPTLGGMAVGRLLRDRPETHGHGVPEVVRAVKSGANVVPADRGLLKLVASAITIGSGGSAGREGPIVYGGAAFASSVGRVLGFSRRELSILLACGAGAGISASFNAPIAGAVFAMEIILREFELRVFSPIILASVAGTLVSQGVLGEAPMLRQVPYELVSGSEVLAYAALGIGCGLLAFTFVRLLHGVEHFFHGRMPGQLSPWLGKKSLPFRAGLGGLCAGVLAFVSPTVWGSGHDYINLAAVGKLPFFFLVTACLLKLVATAVTIGSGGSGGTFFPAAVIGAMAGGAFGTLVHYFFPASTGPSGAYALVGMGGAVAALNRGPLTGMMMMYELSGNHDIILPLMVTCTIASALCHYLIERKQAKVVSDADLLESTPVQALMEHVAPVPAGLPVRPLADLLLRSETGALPVLDTAGEVYGIVQVEQLREVWSDESVYPLLVASDLSRKLPVLSPEADLAHALRLMDQEDVDALPVSAPTGIATRGLLTRAAVRRFLFAQHARHHSRGDAPISASEVTH
ncbi:chloride channel protein [Myxococcus sp. K38C18041901]|uniref:chloride channel protein n=1 Tax=Myxococcus guangdongensis TaxID=2906760 RepID=UPI0020A7DADD|nr:chloride channel protein [Myxococcus guangdongensis]MCP3059768.1 chloride channel protein [Myxococcus guangdongensis]